MRTGAATYPELLAQMSNSELADLLVDERYTNDAPTKLAKAEIAKRLRALDDKREPEERNHESTTDWYARNVCGHGGEDAKRDAMDRAGECYDNTASDRRSSVETMPVYDGYSNREIMERIGELEQHIKKITTIAEAEGTVMFVVGKH